MRRRVCSMRCLPVEGSPRVLPCSSTKTAANLFFVAFPPLRAESESAKRPAAKRLASGRTCCWGRPFEKGQRRVQFLSCFQVVLSWCPDTTLDRIECHHLNEEGLFWRCRPSFVVSKPPLGWPRHVGRDNLPPLHKRRRRRR